MTKNDTLIAEIMRDYSATFTALKEYDMEKKSDADFKVKEIERAIKLAYDSLLSHLPYTYSGKMIRSEDRQFHKTAVADYATIIKVLSELY